MNVNEFDKSLEILLITSNTECLYNRLKILNTSSPRISCKIVHISDIIVPLLYMGYKGKIKSPDLIILDSNIEESDIEILTNYFHTNSEFSNIPQVLSVNSFEEKEELSRLGIHPDCFIPQIFDINKLLQLIYSSGTFWLSVIRSQSMHSHRGNYPN